MWESLRKLQWKTILTSLRCLPKVGQPHVHNRNVVSLHNIFRPMGALLASSYFLNLFFHLFQSISVWVGFNPHPHLRLIQVKIVLLEDRFVWTQICFTGGSKF